jgi:glycosyltransferase involved in cell wall biosynthesis
VIATSGRELALLERTLLSIAAAELPKSFRCLWVIENGGRHGVEGLLDRLQLSFPIRYLFSSQPGKSAALNRLLDHLGDEFIVFLDDDVRLSRGIFTAYADAALTAGRGVFFGGPVSVDYEKAPPTWLRPYLPRSVQGWELAGEQSLNEELFLGANWAAFADDIRDAGGFDAQFGPGGITGATGQESAMQRTLLVNGNRPQYLLSARVWHIDRHLSVHWWRHQKEFADVAWLVYGCAAFSCTQLGG